MEEIRAGKLTIRVDDDVVEFVVAGEPEQRAVLNAKDLPSILDFLKSNATIEPGKRVGFRVNIALLSVSFRSRFKTFLKSEGNDYIELTPLDISLTGIQVETEEDVGEVGEPASIKLVLNDNTAELPSTVARRQPNRVAFQFIESIKNGELDPPPELVAIYRTLETRWLQERITS